MVQKQRKRAGAWDVFRLYAKSTLRYPGLVVLSLIGVIGIQTVNLAAPLYLRRFFNLLAASSPGPAAEQSLFGILTVVALWWFISWGANRLEHFVNLRILARAMRDLVGEAFEYMMGHSYNFFISNFAGSLTHKVNKFSSSYQAVFESTVLTFIPTGFFVLGAIVVLFTRNHLLGLALGAWVVIFVLFQIWVTAKRQPLRKVRSELSTKVTATVADAISNHSNILLFSSGKHEKKILKDVLDRWYDAGIRSWNADFYIWAAIGLFMLAIEIGLLFGAVVLWNRGTLTVGDFVLIQAYLLTLFERLVAIQNELRRLYDAIAEGGEMLEILTVPHEVPDAPHAKKLQVTEKEITFDEVDFYFHADRPILQKFNMRIAGGEKVALVGPSGAGKSTITKLLLRLYDVKGGRVEISGQDIARVTQDSLRDAIAFVPQEPILFHRTLMENIRYGRRDATDEEVLEAAHKAHCHEFIASLPQGYETYVGERGIKLSGGERQRVAIARAILKNAPILLLDEATSSLDSESEALIQDALETLMQGKTVIVIAHRLSTIMKMDRIIVIEHGKVVSEGTHDELLEHKGLYHKLWSIQAGGFLDEDKEEEFEETM